MWLFQIWAARKWTSSLHIPQFSVCATYICKGAHSCQFLSFHLFETVCHFSTVYARLIGPQPSRDCPVFTSCDLVRVLVLPMQGLLQLGFHRDSNSGLHTVWQVIYSLSHFTSPHLRFLMLSKSLTENIQESLTLRFLLNQYAFWKQRLNKILNGYCRKTTKKMKDAWGHLYQLEYLSVGNFC